MTGEGGLKLKREGSAWPWPHFEVLRQCPSLAFIILNPPSEEAPQGGGCEGGVSIIVQGRLQARRRVGGGARGGRTGPGALARGPRWGFPILIGVDSAQYGVADQAGPLRFANTGTVSHTPMTPEGSAD